MADEFEDSISDEEIFEEPFILSKHRFDMMMKHIDTISASPLSGGNYFAYSIALKEFFLTDDQLTALCHNIVGRSTENSTHLIYLLAKHQTLDDHHVDILLSSTRYSDRWFIFTHREYLTPDQILIGLRDSDTKLQRLALNHACCTEAVRVRHHLTGGTK